MAGLDQVRLYRMGGEWRVFTGIWGFAKASIFVCLYDSCVMFVLLLFVKSLESCSQCAVFPVYIMHDGIELGDMWTVDSKDCG